MVSFVRFSGQDMSFYDADPVDFGLRIHRLNYVGSWLNIPHERAKVLAVVQHIHKSRFLHFVIDGNDRSRHDFYEAKRLRWFITNHLKRLSHTVSHGEFKNTMSSGPIQCGNLRYQPY